MTVEPENSIVPKPLGQTSIEELTGVKANGGDVVLVNLNRVAMTINCGSCQDFLNSIQMTYGVKAAVWNEHGITLALADRYTVIKYEPPIHKMAKMFFDEKGNHGQWSGNYEPVYFTKIDLLKFLQEVGVQGGTEAIVTAVANMKLRETRRESDVISLDDDKTISTVEESFETNIPRKFTINIPVTPDFVGEFQFEARPEKPSERLGGSDSKQKKIALYCLNPLEIQRAAVQHVLDKMPQEIPRIYGEMKLTTREHW
jgi:hypothetical protein